MGHVWVPEDRQAQIGRIWFNLAALLIAVGLITHQHAPFVMAACLVTVIPIAWLWSRAALRGLTYEREFDTEYAFPCETVRMTIRVTNRKLLPLSWLEITDRVPTPLPLVGGELRPTHLPEMMQLNIVLSLRWYERVHRQYNLMCTKRGIYWLGPVTFRSGDIFTLFETQEDRPLRNRLVVYPQVWTFEELGWPSKDPFGDRKARQRLVEDPLRTRGIRDYHPEDGWRYVHWKATARRGELQVRMLEPTASLSLVIFLNIATFRYHWQGVIPDLLERLIGVTGSIAIWALDQKYKVGLIANGSFPLSDQPIRVPAGRSPGQRAVLLEALAALGSVAMSPIHDLLQWESPGLPWGATLVVVTAIVTDPLLAVMLRLRDAGRQVVLVSLSEELPAVPKGIVVYHLPPSSPVFQAKKVGCGVSSNERGEALP